jgi:uncharacterized protein (TIGR02996 family)
VADELVAYLHGLPDDWDSWLVYADQLTERGDPRGEILVLEHRRDPEAKVLADAWIAGWGEQLFDEDADHHAWLRTLEPLAGAPTPPDLRPAFARPISQLLALLEPSDHAREGLSPVLQLQRDRVLAATIAWIERAFDSVPAPDDAHRTIEQAEAADNYEEHDRSGAHLGRWQELPDDHLLANQWALSHLDEQGIHYYVPAAMCFALRHHISHNAADHWITESLEYTLQPSGANLRDYEQRRFALFDRAQRQAIYAFALVRGHTVGAAAWSRVYEAERERERADWFELYSPI